MVDDVTVPDSILNGPTDIHEILAPYSKTEIPLFHSGTLIYVDDREAWDRISYALGEYESHVGFGGKSQFIANAETGENYFIFGEFRGDVSILAHEAAHITFYILCYVGEALDPEGSNETFCHLLQHIMEWALTLHKTS